MRPFQYLPKCLRVLLIANAIVFGLAFVAGNLLGIHLDIPVFGYVNIRDLISFFGMYMPTAPLEIWRYVTYMFVHIDFFHFLFNMLMLWMFGNEIADMMGAKHFTVMYFFCGVFAAVFSLAMCVLGLSCNPIIGASGALMGIFVAYYKFFPDRMMLIFFVIPMKIKHAIWFMVAIDVFLAPSGDGVAHLAHLGGVVGGFIYMYLYNHGFKSFARFSKPKFRVDEGGRRGENLRRKKSGAPLEGEVFDMDENKRMDDILKKVNREGINSLTDAERQFLLRAGERIRRRRGGM
ncbi:MAG: rhomboid family intramembrane serine protease [Fibrobacter sp.]|nr:rhomboid family intramembrane serine protease [Fibrobacter sp.]